MHPPIREAKPKSTQTRSDGDKGKQPNRRKPGKAEEEQRRWQLEMPH